MNSFLSEVASYLYNQYGDDISSLKIVFPNRRAQLFFCDALMKKISRPIWQPTFVSIQELMEHISGLHTSDRIKLIVELYKVYSKYHQETFDSFYFWGDMLLSDFDQIDKYMIPADVLFSNIHDLKTIESDLSYLTPEQREVIAQFWTNFNLNDSQSDSEEKKHFWDIWESLSKIYHEFREVLTRQGLAYEGMVYRTAAETLRSDAPLSLPGDNDSRFVVVGFNALSVCEKQLFLALKKSGRADFFWDYDSYYVDNKDFEAGMFLRDNLRDYPPPDMARISHAHFSHPKKMTCIAAPSDSLQCKYVHTFLKELIDRGEQPDKETAIVLTDESLLIPVLHSIPAEIKSLNVTMGYPLQQTTAYSFVERLIELQSRKRQSKSKDCTRFYHSDVIGLLNHPYIQESQAETANRLIQEIRRKQIVYANSELFPKEGIIGQIFTPTGSWTELATYLQEILSRVANQPDSDNERKSYFHLIVDHLVRIKNSLIGSDVDLTPEIFASLLRRTLQPLRIPFQGEPLQGIQIMGILETRVLDFKNVLILSANDDTFPGNRMEGSSFIPYNLRYGYGLPTAQHHEGVFAYYFYRLLQRAERVDIAYCSNSDDKRSGEPSRYIYQLLYESKHNLNFKPLQLQVNLSQTKPIKVDKKGAVADALKEFLDTSSKKQLSPTSLYQYLECPLRFYFRSIAKLSQEEEIAEEIDLPMFGTILHRTMELLYKPLKENPDPQTAISQIKPQAVKAKTVQAINEMYLQEQQVAEEEYNGNMILVRDVVTYYITHCILPFDSSMSRPNFTIEGTEIPVQCPFSFEGADGQSHTVTFAGKSDRIDRLDDDTRRIVDYKTGASHIEFSGIDSLFNGTQQEHNSAAFQTLLYSLMFSKNEYNEIQPALYYVRDMQNKVYSPLLQMGGGKRKPGKTEISRFSMVQKEFEKKLRETLRKLFDLSVPFEQCKDAKYCTYCDFKKICRR
ncbi:MAG TPA: PD-(D/E)XK nuclease family protein [Candidatus Alistipes merdigallinarum]|nr:PD-(D/E)XK nuclease family protein [Candidatus Alistipes merdigallinarum]